MRPGERGGHRDSLSGSDLALPACSHGTESAGRGLDGLLVADGLPGRCCVTGQETVYWVLTVYRAPVPSSAGSDAHAHGSGAQREAQLKGWA